MMLLCDGGFPVPRGFQQDTAGCRGKGHTSPTPKTRQTRTAGGRITRTGRESLLGWIVMDRCGEPPIGFMLRQWLRRELLLRVAGLEFFPGGRSSPPFPFATQKRSDSVRDGQGWWLGGSMGMKGRRSDGETFRTHSRQGQQETTSRQICRRLDHDANFRVWWCMGGEIYGTKNCDGSGCGQSGSLFLFQRQCSSR